jgi:hypothetical protein
MFNEISISELPNNWEKAAVNIISEILNQAYEKDKLTYSVTDLIDNTNLKGSKPQ